ncbi:sensor histidine kinase [Aquimonas voraii]|uniref:sensor histidine kinase n=1 Tax=Aquimonas voraii TaxID=265719 RepID=UPI000B81F3E4|nr:two-component regulator propeller domain-containing protein [Aquimonas voraii]
MLLCLLPQWVQAAFDPVDLRFRRLDQESGLSQGSVLALAQDAQGFVWMGTQDGLNRFDGFEFRVFRPDAASPGSLSNNWVSALAVDAEGALWIGTQAGLNLLRRDVERFEVFRHHPDDPRSLVGDSVLALHIDGSGRLWIGTDAGLSLREVDGGFVHHRLPGADQRVRALLMVGDVLWLGTVEGLWRFHPDTGEFARAPTGPAEGRPVHALAVDGRGRLWVGGEQLPLSLLDPATGAWQTAPEARSEVRSLQVDRSGVVWAGDETGLQAYREDADGALRVRRYEHQRHQRYSLGRGRVMSLLEDRTGTLWIGTWEGGVSRLSAYNNRFRSHDPDSSSTRALRAPGIAALVADGDALWLGGAEALYRFRPGQEPLSEVASAPGGFIYSMDLQPEGLWLASREGLHVLDRQRRMRPAPLPPALQSVRSRRFLVDGERVWVAADTRGLFVVDRARGEVLAEHPLPAIVTFIEALDEDTVVLGAHDGLYWFDRHSGALRHQHPVMTPPGPGQLPAGPSALLQASNGRLWLATYGGGLLELLRGARRDPARVELRPALAGTALAAGSLNALLEDDQGRLWISINGAIAHFDPARGELRRYDAADGVLGRYWIGARARLSDGVLAFAGPDGLTLFDPDDVGRAPPPPVPVLTALELDNRRIEPDEASAVLARPLHRLDALVLPPAQARTLSLHFAAPEYVAPEQLQFAYRLDGFDEAWIEAPRGRRIATYTNLPHGDYVFRVRVRNAEGAEAAAEARLPLQVQPFWWDTLGARFLFVLLALGLAAALVGLRMRQLESQRLRLQREVDARTADLTAALGKLALSERLAAAGQLTAGLAHELNNPANYVQLASRNADEALAEFHRFLLLLGGEDLEPEVAAAIARRVEALAAQLATVAEGSHRINHIVQALRVFSRLDESERKAAPADEPLRAALQLMDARMRGGGIALESEIPPLPPLQCQPARLSQAFLSILENAALAIEAQRAHAPEGWQGRLRVRARALPERFEFELCDNGCGIAPEVLPHIFEPFFTTRPVGQGSGLGLSVAWGIAAEHGGRLRVDSRPGEGACFILELPR